MGGHIQGRLWPRDEADAAAIRASGRDPTRILYTDDLVRGNDVSVTLEQAHQLHCSFGITASSRWVALALVITSWLL